MSLECVDWVNVGEPPVCCVEPCDITWPTNPNMQGPGFSSSNISARRLPANDNATQNPRIFNYCHCNVIDDNAPNEFYKWHIKLPGANFNPVIWETINYTTPDGFAEVLNKRINLGTGGYGQVKLRNGERGQIFRGAVTWDASTFGVGGTTGTITDGMAMYCGINTKLCTNCTNEFGQTNQNVYYIYCSNLTKSSTDPYYAPFFWEMDCGAFIIRFSAIPSAPYTISHTGAAPAGSSSSTWQGGGVQHYSAWNRNLCPNPSQGSTLCMSATKAEIHWKGPINYNTSPFYGYNSRFQTMTSHRLLLDPRTALELSMGAFPEQMGSYTKEDWDRVIPLWPPS